MLAGLSPVYPLYALLFAETGLTGGQVSALFALWSGTALLAEVPAGALADRWSRRGVLVVAGVLEAGCFAIWTVAPSGPAFAAGFVLWGVAGALVSGTVEALVVDGLAACGAAGAFARVNGAMTAAELLVQVPTAVAATLLFTAGGHPLVGWVSVAVCLAYAALALRFPEPPRERAGSDVLAVLRAGVRTALRRPALRLVVLAVAVLGGLDAVEEYFPVLAGEWGVSTAAVPLAVLAVALAGALGAWLGGRADRLPSSRLLGLLGAAALALGIAALWARPAALGLVALGYGLYLAVLVVAEARLQERIPGPNRATVTSVAGLGVELASLAVFAAWAAGGLAGAAVLVLATLPLVGRALGPDRR
ncbi:MFS transporter [Blastococcus sp. SYSU D00820]